MKRTFIALKIQPEKPTLDCISELKRKLANEKIKWVDPGNLHITLRFLGDTSEENIPRISDLLDRLIPRFHSPEVLFRGIGIFRNLRDPRVIWIGLQSHPTLNELHESLEIGIGKLGWLREKQDFCPHLTIGRIKYLKDKKVLAELVDHYSGNTLQLSKIPACTCYESILKPGGPAYHPLHEVSFKPASR